MPKIIFLSDTHGFHEQVVVPDGDIVVHAGDSTGRGTFPELERFHAWFVSHPHNHKVFVAGNHDWPFEREPERVRELFSDVTYLQDAAAIIMGLKFYGSPWQPRFLDWAFNLERGEPLRNIWAKIPEDTDVLVTHGPPYGILDWCERDQHVGCKDLLARVEKVSPKRHLFGHVHEGYGTIQEGSSHFVNGAICDEWYNPRNRAAELSLKVSTSALK